MDTPRIYRPADAYRRSANIATPAPRHPRRRDKRPLELADPVALEPRRLDYGGAVYVCRVLRALVRAGVYALRHCASALYQGETWRGPPCLRAAFAHSATSVRYVTASVEEHARKRRRLLDTDEIQVAEPPARLKARHVPADSNASEAPARADLAGMNAAGRPIAPRRPYSRTRPHARQLLLEMVAQRSQQQQQRGAIPAVSRLVAASPRPSSTAKPSATCLRGLVDDEASVSLSLLVEQLKEQRSVEFRGWDALEHERRIRDAEVQQRQAQAAAAAAAAKLRVGVSALSKAEDAEVTAAMRRPADTVLVDLFNIEIRPRDLRTLGERQWLNDEVINFYTNLISARSREQGSLPRVHCMSTFFYTTLEKRGYAGVQRWLRKARVRLQDVDLFIVPVHLHVHWCLAVVNRLDKRLEYWDSMGGGAGHCLDLLRDYCTRESGGADDMSAWPDYRSPTAPQQRNGYDCGVFACKTAECIARRADIDFDQSDMHNIRRRMALGILRGRLA